MSDTPPQTLEFSGERFTPECVREIRYEHLHRYAMAGELARNRVVLDAACGEGYGSRILADTARTVTGVDVSAEAISHAQKRYVKGNLEFVASDCLDLPFADDHFDCIVSFETLEHLEDQEALIAELRRVLKPEGFALISSPDRAVYTDLLQTDNPYHVRELYRAELEALLARAFPAVRLMGQKLGFQSMIWDLSPHLPTYRVQRESGEGIEPSPVPGGEAVYFIALCAARNDYFPESIETLWLFDDVAESVYSHYHHEIQKNMQAGKILQAKDEEIESLKAKLQQRVPESNADPQRPWWQKWFGGS